MSNKIIGIAQSNFEKDGTTFKGYSLYHTYSRDKVEGLACGREWVKASVFEESPCSVGDEVMFRYNRYGKIDSIEVL